MVAGTTSYLPASRRAVLTFAEPLLAGIYRGEVANRVADVAGNRIASAFSWAFTAARLPRVSIVATDAQASEVGPDAGSLTITRTGPTTSSLLIELTIGGTADNVDFEIFSPFVLIPQGQTSVAVPVTPLLDDQLEVGETAVFTITPSSLYVVAQPDSATVAISDSGITLTIAATDPNASEETLDPGAFTITRTGPSGVGLSVNLVRGGTATDQFDDQNVALSPFRLSSAIFSRTSLQSR